MTGPEGGSTPDPGRLSPGAGAGAGGWKADQHGLTQALLSAVQTIGFLAVSSVLAYCV